MTRFGRLIACAWSFAIPFAMSFAIPLASAAAVRVLEVKPSEADPAVHDFDEPSYALTPDGGSRDLPLVVFLTGTGGRPRNLVRFLGVAVEQGYRALALEYDDEPAVSQVCPKDPDPDCSEAFRAMRSDGSGASTTVRNPPAEGIVARLVAALRALDRADPASGWGGYLDGDAIRWDRLVVGGLSQGAGMAAYLAKHHAVRRVVLFSSPWDFTGRTRRPAPWLSKPGETPLDRWYAEYHARELTASAIQRAYALLEIPTDHVRVFDQDLAADAAKLPNPYHVNTIRDARYVDQWRFLFGRADDVPAGASARGDVTRETPKRGS